MQYNNSDKRFSRRRFLHSAAGLGMAGMAIGRGAPQLWAADERRKPGRARPRPDLLDADSPQGTEVFQLTTEPDVSASHLYMEAQVFTPDSKRFILHRSATPHGSRRGDPKHQYLLCDVENDFALAPLTEELDATAASVSPDGKYLYYFVDETKPDGGRLTLKRVNLDGTDRRTIVVVDAPLPGTKLLPRGEVYPLSTISSDGRRLALSAWLGEKSEGGTFGLMIFDIERAAVSLALEGPTWCNMHPQYCRSTDAGECHDILVQENHGCKVDVHGAIQSLIGESGADIHVIRDDGTNFRDMPWGRDGNEFCQGHQCWRGRTTWAITSTGTNNPPENQLIEGRAAPAAGHLGIKTPGGARNDLSRLYPKPMFGHFATDAEGKRLITDSGGGDRGGRVYLAELGKAGKDPLRDWRCLANPKTSWGPDAHIHPFLSPDGRMGFFNSDESGTCQTYAVRGF